MHSIELPLDWAPGATQVYLIEGQPLTLVDTGVSSTRSTLALGAALDSLGYGFADIERVVVTHAHRDRFGFVQGLREAGATLECCVHHADADRVERDPALRSERIAAMTALFTEFGVPEELARSLGDVGRASLPGDLGDADPTRVDRVLTEGDRLEWKDWGLDVLHTPGHTPGHLVLEDPSIGLLFAGGQVMAQAIPYAENFYVDEAPDPNDALRRRPRFRGLVEMRATLRRLRSRSVRTILPGFGPNIPRGDRAVRDTLLHYEVRLQRIDRGLRRLAAMGQDVTAFELWKALFPGEAPGEPMRSHLLMLIGALDCLEEDGLLVTERRSDGVLTHHHR